MPDQNPIVKTPSVTPNQAEAILDAVENTGINIESFLDSVESTGYVPFPKNERVENVHLVVQTHISESGNTCWKLVVSKPGYGDATVFIGQEDNNLGYNFRLLNSIITLCMHSHGRTSYQKTQPKSSLKKLVDTFIELGGGSIALDIQSARVDRYQSGNGEWNQSLKLNPSASSAKTEKKTEGKTEKKTVTKTANTASNASALGLG